MAPSFGLATRMQCHLITMILIAAVGCHALTSTKSIDMDPTTSTTNVTNQGPNINITPSAIRSDATPLVTEEKTDTQTIKVTTRKPIKTTSATPSSSKAQKSDTGTVTGTTHKPIKTMSPPLSGSKTGKSDMDATTSSTNVTIQGPNINITTSAIRSDATPLVTGEKTDTGTVNGTARKSTKTMSPTPGSKGGKSGTKATLSTVNEATPKPSTAMNSTTSDSKAKSNSSEGENADTKTVPYTTITRELIKTTADSKAKSYTRSGSKAKPLPRGEKKGDVKKPVVALSEPIDSMEVRYYGMLLSVSVLAVLMVLLIVVVLRRRRHTSRALNYMMSVDKPALSSVQLIEDGSANGKGSSGGATNSVIEFPRPPSPGSIAACSDVIVVEECGPAGEAHTKC